MELSRRTTILLSPELHVHLLKVARLQGTSLGDLVRRACEEKYGFRSVAEKLRSAEEVFNLNLPVGSPDQMDRESEPPAAL